MLNQFQLMSFQMKCITLNATWQIVLKGEPLMITYHCVGKNLHRLQRRTHLTKFQVTNWLQMMAHDMTRPEASSFYLPLLSSLDQNLGGLQSIEYSVTIQLRKQILNDRADFSERQESNLQILARLATAHLNLRDLVPGQKPSSSLNT